MIVLHAGCIFKPINYIDVLADSIHRWIVISDPQKDQDSVLCVSVTSYKDRNDHSCILEPSEHLSFNHKSIISYRDSKVVSNFFLDELLSQGSAYITPPIASDLLLTKIRQCAQLSDYMQIKHLEILVDQGFIPPIQY